MGITSFAQNGEDIILYRALAQFEKGFYIDVGACDPVDMSVTKLFYDSGWSGINLEPDETYFELLVSQRKRDINLPYIVSSEGGYSTFYSIDKKGLSTACKQIAEDYERDGFKVTSFKRRKATLNEVFSSYVDDEVQFIKIDVEGYEASVINGNDWTINRPWVVVVESTRPNTPIASYKEWESVLLDANYLFAYFDGLNRYYVARDKEFLIEKIALQPNVFDEYLRYDHRKAMSERARLEKKFEVMDQLVNHLGKLETELLAERKKIWKLEHNQENFDLKISGLQQDLSKVEQQCSEIKRQRFSFKLLIRKIVSYADKFLSIIINTRPGSKIYRLIKKISPQFFAKYSSLRKKFKSTD